MAPAERFVTGIVKLASSAPMTALRQEVPAPTEPSRAGTLYISHDGVLEPLGESQVVGYLRHLSRHYDVTLISFEKQEDLGSVRCAALRTRLTASGIRWVPLRYHNRPPVLATALDALRAVWHGATECRRGRVRLVHARSYVAAVIGLILRKAFGVAFVFDMRGFWADEKVDGGRWSSRSPRYRIAKWCERYFFESADAIVSLTHEGVKAFPDLGYRIPGTTLIEVVPTCTDLQRFVPGPKDPALEAELELEGRLVVGCAGTMSNWYLRCEMLECLACLARRLPDVKVFIATREDHAQLRADAQEAGLADEQLVLRRVPFDAMPRYLRLMDLGVFFIKPCFSKKASAATKLGEFLACGVPVLINDGVGDSGTIVREAAAGVVLPVANAGAYETSVEQIRALLRDPATPRRCREAAARYFDLEAGSRTYMELYERIIRQTSSGRN